MEGQLSRFKPTQPHFRKVISEENVRNPKMVIPHKFAMEYGEELKEQIYIYVPRVDRWLVNLKKNNEKIWFEDGWLDFVRFYSIQVNHFLAFRYEGNSEFHVLIFDTSATEIEYPKMNNKHSESKMSDVEDNDFNFSGDDIFNDSPTYHKGKEKIPMNQSGHCGAANEKRKVNFFGSMTKVGGRSMSYNETYEAAQKKQAHMQKKRAIGIEKAFKSENSFYVILMQPSYVSSGYVNIPRSFAWKFFGNGKMKATLQTSGRNWQVKYYPNSAPRFSAGWRKFVEENNVKVADICIFELVDSQNFIFKVTICRANEDAEAS